MLLLCTKFIKNLTILINRAKIMTKSISHKFEFILVLIIAIGTITGCEEKSTIEPYDPSKGYAPIGVLNDNTSYTNIYDTAVFLSGANGSLSNIGVYDFTIEENRQLNAVFFTSLPTQQSPLIIPHRFSKNLINNQMVAVPSTVNQFPQNLNIAYDKVIRQFFPYSNIFSSLVEKNGMGQFVGDIDGTITGGIGNPQGQGDFSFRYPVFNSGGFYGNFSRLNSGNPEIGSSFNIFRAGIGSNANLNYYRVSCLHEVYNNNNSKEYYAIGVTVDSVHVFKIDFSFFGDNNNYPVFTASMINAIQTNVIGTLEDRTLRHYSPDGKILSFMITELNTNKRSTYVYNFETNVLTQNLDKVSLEYADASSDIDIDENGDIYYTGFAGNGSNMNGVSVYKKSGASPSVLYGSDNFLKFGTIVKLKILFNNVYLAVSGKQSGKDVYQISFIKQN